MKARNHVVAAPDFSSRSTKSHLFRNLLLPLLAIAISLASAARTLAINASPNPVDLIQPDGTRITLTPKGDEYAHWFEDRNGFTVVRSQGNYVYAQRGADGGLDPTLFMVGHADPRALNLPDHLRPSAQFINGARRSLNMANAISPTTSPASRVRAVGNVKNLVILCRFSDHTLGVHTRAPEDYQVLMNTNGGSPTLAPSGSLKDFYREASYGTVTVDSTVIAWVTLPQSEAYYCNGLDGFGNYPQNAQGMVRDALIAADSIVNFAQFDQDNDGYVDAIDIIHSGYAAETGGGNGNWIWSHKWNLAGIPGGVWTSGDRNANNVFVKVFDYHTEAALWDVSGTNILRVGVIAHETGHFFGLPDLYDTDGTSEGIGSYCLMANSWGFDGSQYHPPHPSAWSKIQLGWMTPTNIVPGTYNVPRAESVPMVYKITNGYPSGEYLLIENRQSFGFESMPQGGLCIWHIDDTVDGNNDESYPGSLFWPFAHYQIALLQADGQYQLERGINRGDGGDVYRSGGISAISGATVPGTQSYQSGSLVPTANIITNIGFSASNMTFTFVNPNVRSASFVQVVAVDATLRTESYTPTNRAMDPGELVTVSYRLRNVGTTNADVTATLLPVGGVMSPSAPKIYSMSNLGNAVSNIYSYIVSGQCGSTITNTLQLQWGGSNIGTATFTFPIGAPIAQLKENFDTVKPPALPTNWSTSALLGGWVTVPNIFSSPSNSAFISDPETISDASLFSSQFAIVSTNAVLTFSHRYNTEYGFDGGVLEISFNNGPFVDIVAAGGTFERGGYNFFLDESFGNPLAGRDAWTGNSTNFIATTIDLPATAAGKTARLRWRFGSDSAVGGPGWHVDSVLVSERGCGYAPQLPSIVNARHEGTNVVFSFTGRSGVYYSIEYKNSMSDPAWIPLVVQPASGVQQSITNNLRAAQRFYRLRSL